MTTKHGAPATESKEGEGQGELMNGTPRRVRELSDKLPFSSRISPSHRQMLLDLERRTRVKQVALLEEALDLLALKYRHLLGSDLL